MEEGFPSVECSLDSELSHLSAQMKSSLPTSSCESLLSLRHLALPTIPINRAQDNPYLPSSSMATVGVLNRVAKHYYHKQAHPTMYSTTVRPRS